MKQTIYIPVKAGEQATHFVRRKEDITDYEIEVKPVEISEEEIKAVLNDLIYCDENNADHWIAVAQAKAILTKLNGER